MFLNWLGQIGFEVFVLMLFFVAIAALIFSDSIGNGCLRSRPLTDPPKGAPKPQGPQRKFMSENAGFTVYGGVSTTK